MNVSAQAREVYDFLVKKGEPTLIRDVAFKLRIPSSDVYRLTKPLVESGLISESEGFPTRLQVRPPGESLGLFLLSQSHWFTGQFGSQTKESSQKAAETDMQLAFVQGRDELMNKSATEIDQSSISVDLLRSGHEMPPEVMRALVQSIQRGVKVRMLIQDYGEENREQVENWTRNGIEVKKTKLTHLRLMLYDSKVCYFMSYKHPDSAQDMGMKIVYPPFAAILSQYFSNLWQKSEKI